MLAKHRQEGGEERSGEACEQDGLDLNYRVWGSCPLWESGNVVAECGVVDLVNQDAQQSGSLIVWIGLELRVDFDDECRGDC